MLIDDNKIDLFINKKMIEKFDKDIQVNMYPNAILALKHLKNSNHPKKALCTNVPDVIFLDINMPEMDGFQFLFEYNKLTGFNKNRVQIYMLSSSASLNDVENAKNNACCTDYLVKPLTLKKLNNILV